MGSTTPKKAVEQNDDSRYRIIEGYDGQTLRVDVQLAREAMREAMIFRANERELHTNEQPQSAQP
jgi:hypothetical protein